MDTVLTGITWHGSEFDSKDYSVTLIVNAFGSLFIEEDSRPLDLKSLLLTGKRYITNDRRQK